MTSKVTSLVWPCEWGFEVGLYIAYFDPTISGFFLWTLLGDFDPSDLLVSLFPDPVSAPDYDDDVDIMLT